ncbi:PerC family transcriptional regulator [Salmonella enterica]|nr:PerC family transcriptional regulator [Salmonella enterica subsp. enterica]EKP5433312.1 PerC family transcriptional regulator [Salmonella enterica]
MSKGACHWYTAGSSAGCQRTPVQDIMTFVFQDFQMGNLTKQNIIEMSYLSVKKAKKLEEKKLWRRAARQWLVALCEVNEDHERAFAARRREYCFSEAQKVTSKLKLRNR